MASASSIARFIKLKDGEVEKTIAIYDGDIQEGNEQNVKKKACAAFEINFETVETVTFIQRLPVGAETLQVTLMPGDIVSAYDAAKESSGPLSANTPFVFQLDVQFGVSLQRSRPTGPPVASASVGGSLLPDAGRKGSKNTVQAHPQLSDVMKDMMQNMLAADDNGVYYVVSDGAKGQHSNKHGAAQGEQTQDIVQWDACIKAIMATDVYMAGQIGRERLEKKMRHHIGYVRATSGAGNPNTRVQAAMLKIESSTGGIPARKKVKARKS